MLLSSSVEGHAATAVQNTAFCRSLPSLSTATAGAPLLILTESSHCAMSLDGSACLLRAELSIIAMHTLPWPRHLIGQSLSCCGISCVMAAPALCSLRALKRSCPYIAAQPGMA